MDPEPISEPTTPIASPRHQTTAQSPIRDETSIISEEHNSPSSDAVLSPVSEPILESALCSISSTKSPALQIMERPEDHSNRHSSSSEWSSVSNESLFSIHITHSDRHDHAHLLDEDAFAVHDSLTFIKSFSKSDVDDLNMETLDDLDEPQKVVRWKTQVEHHADEGVSSQGQQCESSPLTDHKTDKPEKKFCWSSCDCRSWKTTMWSCWNSCRRFMTCSNCKPKKVCSSHSSKFTQELCTKKIGGETFIAGF